MQERLTAMEHEFAIVTGEVTAKLDEHTIMLRDLNSAMSEQGQELKDEMHQKLDQIIALLFSSR